MVREARTSWMSIGLAAGGSGKLPTGFRSMLLVFRTLAGCGRKFEADDLQPSCVNGAKRGCVVITEVLQDTTRFRPLDHWMA
mmetsp:Transcript_29602/g.78372  ORF Transcript_29602/g.78372 Transcript_29602/m.78372 type:complete len:82 (-) Transcript_29602:179-424(-)